MIPDQRLLNILKTNSFFLFGARGTGKTTLISQLFPPDQAILIDLLDNEVFSRLLTNPQELSAMLSAERRPWCIIDEVQKIPAILDVVHSEIEKKKI